MPEGYIDVILDGEPTQVRSNISVGEALGAKDDQNIVAALLNYDIVSLNFRPTHLITVAPVLRKSREGREVVNRTSTHILEAVLAKHFRNLHFQIGQALHQGYYYELLEHEGPEEVDLTKTAADIDRLVSEMIEADLPIEETVVNVESAAVMVSDRRGSSTKLLETWPGPRVPIAQLDEFVAIQYGPLCPSTRYSKGIRIVPFPKGIILQFARNSVKPAPSKSTRLLGAYRESREWNRMIGVATVGDLNDAILQDRISDVIQLQEGLHEKKIIEIADAIAARRDKLRLICIAGPSSSGKTTFVQRLSVQLKVAGIQPVIIGLDDYYRDRTFCPRDEEGQLDFEALDALDIPLLTSHLEALVKGEAIRVPRFDFVTGQRVSEDKFKTLQLAPNQMLLIEGIHGLNPTITEAVPAWSRYRIFVSALTQLIIDEHNRIPTSDGRLLRRIVRDRRYRGTSAAGTIDMWKRVRRGEQRNIFPFQEHCDIMFNSALVYEAAVFKTFAWRYLLEVKRDEAARVQAQALMAFLDLFVPIFPDNVPSNSVLREFIGGSLFTY